jgi:protein TonB
MKGSPEFFASLVIALVIHGLLFAFLYIPAGERELREDPTVFKLVDIDLYTPPLNSKEPTLSPQETTAEKIEETDKPVQEPSVPYPLTPPPAPLSPPPSRLDEPEYLPPHKISVPPKVPVDEVLRQLVYPPQANRQRIEGVVYLELFIDREGVIRKIEVLKDPGYGLADAAVKAFQGVRCNPAEANGVPVAVRYRYPIRFKLR